MIRTEPFSDEELKEAMKELDGDDSGSVSFDEFKKYWDENIAAGGYAIMARVSD
jgi:Ca2+-binding EF-hand superfamily protein